MDIYASNINDFFSIYGFFRILKGSSLLAAVAMYNWVHENSVEIAFRGQYPSESQLYEMGLWAYPRSFRRIYNVRIITNLNREEPEANGSPNDPLLERFGHLPHINLEPAQLVELDPPVIPFHEPWVPEDEPEDHDDGYDDGFESDDTVENEPQIIRRLRLQDRDRLVWAMLHN
ncbi:unnamed protein product [Orchesella dallaii]|uniref:Uncharacterized protein n=1 Tax=Orchesella dallaii TaxID=48710 RepID=A0ABP1PHN4_9HEXA